MRVVTDPDSHELWKSAIPGTLYLKRFDRKGDLVDEMVSSGKTIHLTPNERRLNQEMAAEPEYDIFTNGYMIPIRLIPNDLGEENADGTVGFQTNSNHMTDDDMKALLEDRKSPKKFADALANISNPMTLQRMIAVATEADASMKQVETIRARIVEMSDGTTILESETVAGPDGPIVSLRAPNVEAPKNAGVGRRVPRP